MRIFCSKELCFEQQMYGILRTIPFAPRILFFFASGAFFSDLLFYEGTFCHAPPQPSMKVACQKGGHRVGPCACAKTARNFCPGALALRKFDRHLKTVEGKESQTLCFFGKIFSAGNAYCHKNKPKTAIQLSTTTVAIALSPVGSTCVSKSLDAERAATAGATPLKSDQE